MFLIQASIHPSIHSSLHLYILPSIHPSIFLSIHQCPGCCHGFTRLNNRHVSTCKSVHLSNPLIEDTEHLSTTSTTGGASPTLDTDQVTLTPANDKLPELWSQPSIARLFPVRVKHGITSSLSLSRTFLVQFLPGQFNPSTQQSDHYSMIAVQFLFKRSMGILQVKRLGGYLFYSSFQDYSARSAQERHEITCQSYRLFTNSSLIHVGCIQFPQLILSKSLCTTRFGAMQLLFYKFTKFPSISRYSAICARLLSVT